jgi:hypothetical protein
MARPTQCFISYSHRDHAACDRLVAHLKAVARSYPFSLWHDPRIRVGFYFNEVIAQAIENSDIFVPLVTNDFFASDYIFEHELPAILARHRDHHALVVPVIYQESLWRLQFGNYIQVTPIDDRRRLRPVRQWRDHEAGFARAASDIAAAIEDWFGTPPVSPFAPVAGAAP